MTTAANAMTTDAMNVITLGAERSSIVPPFKARPVGLKVSLAFPSPRGDHHSRVGFGRASYLMAERAAAFRSVQATPIRVLERQTTRWGLWLPSIQISKIGRHPDHSRKHQKSTAGRHISHRARDNRSPLNRLRPMSWLRRISAGHRALLRA